MPGPVSDQMPSLADGVDYAKEYHEAALSLAVRFSEVFPTIEIRDNEPFYWLADEIATLMARAAAGARKQGES